MSDSPPSGFTQQGTRYELRDPRRLKRADADLWNDTLYFQIDHLGQFYRSGFMAPDSTEYSQNQRQFYVRDNEDGHFWMLPGGAAAQPPEAFRFTIGANDLRWSAENRGIEVTLTVVVAPDDPVELWSLQCRNLSDRPRSLSLFSYLPAGRRSPMRQIATVDPELNGILVEFFPYYVKVEDYYTLKEGWNRVYALSREKPDAILCNVGDFIGFGTLRDPDLLKQRTLPPVESRAGADLEHAGIFQFDRTLPVGGETSVHFAFGPARNRGDAQRIAKRYLAEDGMQKALASAEARGQAHPGVLTVSTPDPDWDAYLNHWQPRRSLMMVRTQRFMSAPQGRNLLQDAMGGALVDPVSSRASFCRFYGFQHQNGWMPHGMPLETGATQIRINTIPHKDINVWGPSAVTFYLHETGDESLLDEEIPFADAPDCRVSLFEHICRGLDWLLRDRTDRGLCRIGQGDWNDPLNMAGHAEKGESVWLSQALIVALNAWIPVCVRRNDTPRADRYRHEAARLAAVINELAWDGHWYLRGFTDAGTPFGSHRDREGRIFLNTQSWAMMAGIADETRTRQCIESVEKFLQTPSGPMILSPAYTEMREDIGKLTLKAPGSLENGSVYCHAATFYAYALYQVRQGDLAFQVLRTLLSGAPGHPLERSGQLPLYIPNAYQGEAAGSRAGQSTHSPNSGTAAWYYRTVIDGLFGLRSQHDGLHIDPQLPSEWSSATAVRRWRGSEYVVHYTRSPRVATMEVVLDGQRLDAPVIRPDSSPSTHQVEVVLPLSNEGRGA